MSERLHCLDKEPRLLIPRMYFVFNEPGQLFQFHIPNVDIEASLSLKNPPGGLQSRPRPKSLQEGLVSCNTENAIGRICLDKQAEMTVADITLNPLPPYDEIDPSIKNYREKWAAQNKTRLPFFEAKHELFKNIVRLSEIQYEFGVPVDLYSTDYPEAPARFSVTHDYNHFVPITVVTPSFEQALHQCSTTTDEANRFTTAARRYVQNHDPEVSRIDTDFVQIARYGILSDGGDFTYGQRGETIADLEYIPEASNYRLQSSDLYVASTHNSGIAYEAIFAMLAVGMINQKALGQVASGLI